MTYPATDHGPDVPAGGIDTDGLMFSPSNHGSDGPGVNYGTPAQYMGPAVRDQAPLVNPSAGNQGPAESGMTDINPQGPAPRPGSAGPSSRGGVYPDTTVG